MCGQWSKWVGARRVVKWDIRLNYGGRGQGEPDHRVVKKELDHTGEIVFVLVLVE